MNIEAILAPVDFSPNSLRIVDFAASLISGTGEIYLLHVIDSDFVARLSEAGFSDAEAATARLRQIAEQRFKEILQDEKERASRLNTMIVVGKPFAEILRVAADLDFDMIVLGIRGRRQGDIEELLFGSTAEKVIRGAGIPVVCVPDPWQEVT